MVDVNVTHKKQTNKWRGWSIYKVLVPEIDKTINGSESTDRVLYE